MAGEITPERTRGWLGLLLPLATQGGPILTIFVLLVGSLSVYYMLGLLDRAVTRNHALVDKMLVMQDAHRAEVLRYVHCQPTP